METFYDILHITGAVCLIAQSIVFIVFILRWQGRIKRMSDSIECLWAEEKRRISERIEQTPSRRNSGPPFIIRPDPDFKKRLVAAMERGLSQNREAVLKPAKEGEAVGDRAKTQADIDTMLTGRDSEFVSEIPINPQDVHRIFNSISGPKAPPPPPLKHRNQIKSQTSGMGE